MKTRNFATTGNHFRSIESFGKVELGSGKSLGSTRDNVIGNAGTAGQHFATTENCFRSNEYSGRMNQALDKVPEPLGTMSPEMLALQDSILQLQETISG